MTTFVKHTQLKISSCFVEIHPFSKWISDFADNLNKSTRKDDDALEMGMQ